MGFGGEDFSKFRLWIDDDLESSWYIKLNRNF